MDTNEQARGDVLKAVASLLSNLGGTVDQPTTCAADINRLQRAWDKYHELTPRAHTPDKQAIDILRDKFTRFIAAYESVRRRFGDDYAGRFDECDRLVEEFDKCKP